MMTENDFNGSRLNMSVPGVEMGDPNPARHDNKNRGHEIIHIQIGKAGNLIGNEFWKDLCTEHRLNLDSVKHRGQFLGGEYKYQEHLNVFFNQGANERWVPRAILLDLNMQDLGMVASGSANNSVPGDCFR